MKSFFTISSIILMLCGCNDRHHLVPQKLAGIPELAFWAGGTDGGNWFLIDSFNALTGTASIKVYNDQTGTLELEKMFRLHCETEQKINWNNLEEEISGFDGHKIHLVSGQSGNRYCYFE